MISLDTPRRDGWICKKISAEDAVGGGAKRNGTNWATNAQVLRRRHLPGVVFRLRLRIASWFSFVGRPVGVDSVERFAAAVTLGPAVQYDGLVR